MAKITEAERAERHRTVESTIGTHAMEGIRIDPVALSIMNSYADGDLTLDQFSAEMNRHAAAVLAKYGPLVGAA